MVRSALPLVGDDDDRAGLGDEKVRAGDADVGLEVAPAQHRAALGDDIGRLLERPAGIELAMMFAEQFGDLSLGLMHGWRDNMPRCFPRQLYDVLAEIGLHRLDAVGGEKTVEADLFRHHRLALGDGAGADALAQIENGAARLRGCRAPVNHAA